MKKFILTISLVLLNISLLTAQKPFFNIYHTDVSDFPTVRMHFNATNLGGQNIPTDLLKLEEFTLTENGQDMILNSDNSPNLEIKCGDLTSDIPLSVILAIDCTTSMEELIGNQTRFDWVIEAANIFIDSLKFVNNTEVAIIGFAGGQVRNTGWLDTREESKSELNNLETFSGVTNFNPPFLDGNFGAIKTFESANPNTRRVIIFLTDGNHDWLGDPNSFEHNLIAEKTIEQGAEIYAIEVNVDNVNNRLNSLARSTNGYFQNIKQREELYTAFEKFYFDLQHKSNKCWFEYTAPLSCAGDDNTRNVFASFDKYVPVYELEQEFSYDAPSDKLITINIDKTELLFSKNTGGTAIHTIELEANEGDFDISDITITPDDGNFQITPKYFTIPKGEKRQITVEYTGEQLAQSTSYQLDIVSSPCETPPVTLISPCTAEYWANMEWYKYPINQKHTAVAKFKNTTLQDLTGEAIINGVDEDYFTIIGDNTINLAPGESKDFIIEFEADFVGEFEAQLNFEVNNECGVFTTNLIASTIEPTIVLDPLNFEELRIGLSETENYEITNTNEDSDITINSIVWQNQNENFGEFNFSSNLPITLSPDEIFYFDIIFNPQTVGVKSGTIVVNIDNIPEPIFLNVTGTGTLPEIEANDVTFDDTDYGNSSDIETITINNDGNEDLLIGEIKLSNVSEHINDFEIITTNLTDLTIEKGTSLELEVRFTPTAGGERSAEIDVVHNSAFGDIAVDKIFKINLTGKAIVNKMPYNFDLTDVNFGDVNSCDVGTFNYSIENNSEEDWELTLEINNNPQNDFLVNGAKTYDFVLEAGQNEQVEITFSPTLFGTQTTTISISSSDGLVTGDATITANAITETIALSIVPFEYPAANYFSPGNEFNLLIDLNVPTYANLTFDKIIVDVEYSHKHNPLDLEKDITFSENGWDINILENSIIQSNPEFSLLRLELSNQSMQNGKLNGVILIPLKAMFNNKIEVPITANAEIENIDCIEFSEAERNVKIEYCGSIYSGIELTEPTQLEKIAPNPLSSSTEISYSTSYDGYVEIALYDITGNKIETYVSENKDSGVYNFNLNVENLNSGKYLLKLSHFDKIVTQPLIIVK